MKFPTPDTSHINKELVYEPRGTLYISVLEDSYLMLDALELEEAILKSLNPTIILEIGCGSGIISTFIPSIIRNKSCKKLNIILVIFCTDINPDALDSTLITGQKAKIELECINCDLGFPFIYRMSKKIDLIIWNPPYVPSDPLDLLIYKAKDIELSWAGGINGRESLLSNNGIFYILLERSNKVEEISSFLNNQGLFTKLVLHRKAYNEYLVILKAFKNQNFA